jgi:hypothetical protein
VDPRNREARNSDSRDSDRRKRQEIDAAANAVRQMKRDGTLEDVSEREAPLREPREQAPRFFLFGGNDDD